MLPAEPGPSGGTSTGLTDTEPAEEHEPSAGHEDETAAEHEPGAVPDSGPAAAAGQDGSAEPAGAPPPGPSRMARTWQAFSAWRRTRPFWAGVVLIASGLELLLIPLPVNSMGLILHIGTGGVLGILIGGLLIACALLFWLNPVHRVFYGIMAILLSVGALIASNLGGFLLGTLLGVVGGSLGFAWAPLPEAPQDAPVLPEDPDEGLDLLAGPPADVAAAETRAEAAVPEASASGEEAAAAELPGARVPGEAPETGDAGSRHGAGFYTALVLAPALLAAAALGVPAMARAASTSGSAPSLILPSIPLLGPGSGSPSPSPSPSPSSGGLLPSLGPSASPSPSPSPSRGKSKSAAPKATVSGAFEASATPSDITANQAVLTGLKFDGVATVQTASGPEQVLKFTMNELSLTGDDLTTMSASGQVLEFKANSFDFTGNVTLLTTSLSGTLLGIPLTFTPKFPPPITLSDMTLGNVDSKNVVTIADNFTIGGLQIISRGSGGPASGG